MKKNIFFLVAIFAVLFIGCEESITPIQPSTISDISYEARPGQIFLQWDAGERNFEYIRITFHDPLTGFDNVRMASAYGDTILIPDTRAKFGTYTFTFQTVSSTGHTSAKQTITAVSLPAPPVAIFEIHDVTITADMLYTNAQEPSEGPLAGLVDGNPATFFHSRWSGAAINEMHFFQVNLPEAISGDILWEIVTRPGGNGDGDPMRMQIEASNDGTNWTMAVANAVLNVPNQRGVRVEGPMFHLEDPYTMFRFTPLARRNADPLVNHWFNLGGFSMRTRVLAFFYDPEAPRN